MLPDIGYVRPRSALKYSVARGWSRDHRWPARTGWQSAPWVPHGINGIMDGSLRSVQHSGVEHQVLPILILCRPAHVSVRWG